MPQQLSIISSDTDVLSGTPVFSGTRVPASALLDRLEEGDTLECFLDDYPTVTREQAQALHLLFNSRLTNRNEAERAYHEFLRAVRELPDVLRVSVYGDHRSASEQSLLVVVPTLYGPTATRVFQLEAETHQKYPNARLEVRVKGLVERGLAPHEAHLVE